MSNSIQMFGMTDAEVVSILGVTKSETGLNRCNASVFGTDPHMFVMSMLSDAQEMLEHGANKETVRQLLNRAKCVLGNDRQLLAERLR